MRSCRRSLCKSAQLSRRRTTLSWFALIVVAEQAGDVLLGSATRGEAVQDGSGSRWNQSRGGEAMAWPIASHGSRRGLCVSIVRTSKWWQGLAMRVTERVDARLPPG